MIGKELNSTPLISLVLYPAAAIHHQDIRPLTANSPLNCRSWYTTSRPLNLSISQHFLLIFPVLITPATPR